MEPLESEKRRSSLFQNLFPRRQSKSGSYTVNCVIDTTPDSQEQFKVKSYVPQDNENHLEEAERIDSLPEMQPVKDKPGHRRSSVFERLRRKFEPASPEDKKRQKSSSKMKELEPTPEDPKSHPESDLTESSPPPPQAQERRRSSLFGRLEELMRTPAKSHSKPKSAYGTTTRRRISGFGRRRSRPSPLEEVEPRPVVMPAPEPAQGASPVKRDSVFRNMLNTVLNRKKHQIEEPQEQDQDPANPNAYYYSQDGPAPRNGAVATPSPSISQRRSSSEYNVIELSKKYRKRELSQKKAIEKVQSISDASQLQKMVGASVWYASILWIPDSIRSFSLTLPMMRINDGKSGIGWPI